ncbi:unnamed protein product, partial [Effrenium voratum]
DILGRAFVVHDFTGARVACGLIHEAAVGSFGAYPGYSGALMPKGMLQVTSTTGMQTLSWIFTSGLDSRCDAECTDANCCGVHIHQGMDCSDAGTIGGHLYNSDYYSPDPWLHIMYNTSETVSIASMVTVATGYDTAAINKRTLVIHDFTGARIACGSIELPVEDAMVSMWHPYPGYTGNLMVDGVMSVSSDDGMQTLAWSLSGLDPECAAAPR